MQIEIETPVEGFEKLAIYFQLLPWIEGYWSKLGGFEEACIELWSIGVEFAVEIPFIG